MRNFLVLIITVALVSCEFIQHNLLAKQGMNHDLIKVARVGDKYLYLSQIKTIIPKGITVQDSIVFVKSYIQSWAKQQIILQKATLNITDIEQQRINELVQGYRQSLYINGYKERLIKQRLDTVITEDDILVYYNLNKDNFKLSQDILKVKYIVLRHDFVRFKHVCDKFKSGDPDDFEDLELNHLNYKDYLLNDNVWIDYLKLLDKIPPFKGYSKSNILKKRKFIKLKDSLGLYLVSIKGVLKKNEVAPLAYVTPKIKSLIRYKRKFELIKEIEKTLIKDAIKTNTFKEFN